MEDQESNGASLRFKSRVQGYRGADSVVMTEEQRPEKATEGEVTVYAAVVLQLIQVELIVLHSFTVKDCECGLVLYYR